MIYVNTHTDSIAIEQAMSKVSEQRRMRAERYRLSHDRQQSLAAYLLLCQGLRERFGIDRLPQLIYGSTGKPVIDGHPEVHISLSHCRHVAACAVSTHPVGIDVETVEMVDDDVLQHTMSSHEQAAIRSSGNPELEFTRLWTMKESLLKLTGQGLIDDLRHVLHQHAHRVVFHTQPMAGCVCTTCQWADRQDVDNQTYIC